MSFAYLIEKIENQPFETTPFKHLEILGFFEPKHFEEIVAAREVLLPEFDSDEALIRGLKENGFRSIPFPGTTQNEKAYLNWHKGKGEHRNTVTCEGIGITFRLFSAQNNLLKEINEFFQSAEFLTCISERFGVQLDLTFPDNGLQKYLDGYEISPHPDIRKKALTYMININPDRESERKNFHTHYLRFRPAYRYVEEYWKYNLDADRCWVPWDWCETVKKQTKNNSFVMFSPSHDTIHAVRARYDHLQTQRTQFYGNLWFHKVPALSTPHWHDFVISATAERMNV